MAPEWVAVVLTTIGMPASLAAARWSNRERQRADEAAHRAEERAEDAVAALRGIELSLSGPAVDFNVLYRREDAYDLVNVGREVATHVTIAEQEGTLIHGRPVGIQLGPGEPHTVILSHGNRLFVTCDQLPAGKWFRVPSKR